MATLWRMPRTVALLTLGILTLGYAVFSLLLQARLPYDGVLWSEFSSSGFSVANVLNEHPGGFQVGDQLIEIQGRDLWAWLDDTLRGRASVDWKVGDEIAYRVRRGDEIVPIQVKLTSFPLGTLLVWRLGAYGLALLSLAVGGYVLIARPQDTAAQLLFLTTVGLTLALLLHVQTMILVTPWMFVVESLLKFLGRSIMCSAFLHLFVLFPVIKPAFQPPHSRRRNWLRALHFFTLLASALIGLIGGHTPANKLALAWQGLLWVSILMLLGGVISIVHTYLTVHEATVRSQIRWIAWGSIVGLLPYIVATALPEALSGRAWLTIEITSFFIVALPVTVAIAVVRYRLFDIDLLIRHSLLYTLILIGLAGIYFLLNALFDSLLEQIVGHDSPRAATFFSTLITVSLFWLWQQRAARTINRLLYPDYVDASTLLAETTEKLSSAIRHEDVEALLTQSIPARVGARGGNLQVLGDTEIQLGTQAGRERLLLWDQLWNQWREQGAEPIVYSMPPAWLPANILDTMVGPNTALIFPLAAGDQMVGLWMLGARRSGLPYTTSETRALNSLARQAAIAVQNARLVRQLESQSQWLVNEVRRRTQDLADEHNRLSVILQNMADGLLVTDKQGRVVLFNTAVQDMLCCRHPLTIGLPIERFVDNPALPSLMRHALDRPGEIPTDHFDLDGHVLLASATALPDRSNVITVLRDITRETEIDRMKSEFISTASHELRTPLTSILGFARLIQRTFDRIIAPSIVGSAEAQRAAQRIQNNLAFIADEGERLTRLINDMLDLAKIEDGKMEWHDRSLSLNEIVKTSLQMLSAQTIEKALELRNRIPAGLPPLVADADRIEQVIMNLVANAIKFTDHGYIEVCAEALPPGFSNPHWQPADPTMPSILVWVRDTGAGIPPQDMARLFVRFQQAVGDVVENKPQGTGLGLAICQEIIKHYGGEIWAESSVGQGSTFYFVLPLRPVDARVDAAETIQ
ncbi:MAG: hypothetical protein JW934_07680 [Anaerolineae bacterium]|nr:hypothetical protein [Anaerolineae bacterium]